MGDERGVGGAETDAETDVDTEADGEAGTGAVDDGDTEAGAEATGVGAADPGSWAVAASPQPDRARAPITVAFRAEKEEERTAQC